MLLYIAFVSALNLCVGYALGAHFGGIPEIRLPKLRLRKREEAPPTGEPLVQPVAAQKSAAKPTSEAEAAVGLAAEDIESGLAAFQQELANMSQRLSDTQDDAQAFGACAKDMQAANHAYLQNTQKQIDGMAPDQERRKIAASGAEEVGKISEEFDSIVEQGLDNDQARANLLAQSGKLSEKVAEVREVVAEAASENGDAQANTEPAADPGEESPDQAVTAPAPTVTAATPGDIGEAVLATLDRLLEQVEGVLETDDSTRCRVAALIHTNPPEEGDGAVPEWFPLVQQRISELIGESLADANLVDVSDSNQCLALLEERDMEAVFKQIETVRTEIAKTTFHKDADKLATTITCALVDLPGAVTTDEVMRRLKETIEESQRQGTNKTYHHDGMFATEVDVKIEAVQRREVKL